MVSPRVHEIARELGVDSKVALAKLRELGEFAKSPSSTIDPAVARRLRAALAAESAASLDTTVLAGDLAGPPTRAPQTGGTIPRIPAAAPAVPVPAPPSVAAPAPARATSHSPAAARDAGTAVVAPEDFVTADRRLFIDTNIFMDTDPDRASGLKKLFERCKEPAVRAGNGIVVPTKVVDELKKQSGLDSSDFTEERSAAVRRAGQWLTALNSASKVGLVRTDLGDGSNPYADDLFVDLFERFGNLYDLCLLTNDITLRLRIRLLDAESDHRLVAGTVCADGRIAVDSDDSLYARGTRKLTRITRHIDDGLGKPKDTTEVETLAPLLEKFKIAFQVNDVATKPTDRHIARPTAKLTPQPAVGAFTNDATLKAKDRDLGTAAIPTVGDGVVAETREYRRALVLGDVLGEGGEGSVFAIEGDYNQVAKIFDKAHRTEHRRAKIALLLSHELEAPGIAFPTSMIENSDGEFIGYTMPRASGKVLQATIMRPARFKKVYPNWTKSDLVDVCISFLEKVAYLHSLNILIGDINPKNLMVDERKNVWIIDADSWQFEGYPCPVGTPMFTASTITGDYAKALRTLEEEQFAVATMLFMILITGQFPYTRAGADGGDFAALIRERKFPYQFKGASDQDQPEGTWKFQWSHLPPKVKSLFWNTFHRDGNRSDRCPTANEWLDVFRDYRQFFDSPDNFDPLSNDVYPFRFRAFRPDTPIRDCPQCERPHAIVGLWDDVSRSYYEPDLCYDCNQSKSRCSDCGKPKPAASLRDGRCWECNRKHAYAECAECGKETPRRYLINGLCSNCQLVPCKDCRTPTSKTSLTHGRCASCVKKAEEMDAARLCADCSQPFITFDHERWFTTRGLAIPKSHQAIKKICPPRRTSTPPSRKPTHTTPPPAPASTSPKKSLWERVVDWFTS